MVCVLCELVYREWVGQRLWRRGMSAVFMTTDLSPQGLVAVYRTLGWKPAGRLAVKLATGETSSYCLRPSLIGDLIRMLDAPIVECNSADGGVRSRTESHLCLTEALGYAGLTEVDILDRNDTLCSETCREDWTMKKWARLGAAILTLTLCLMFGALLLNCMKPMEDRTYDLSLIWVGEAMPEGWVCDPKGWTVFTQEGEVVTELVPNGSGGFDRLDELGQTFYFSRLLSEDVDSPTLRLDATISSVAVFLDGALIYTDCPELDHRIGNLCLPMLDWVREEPVLVTLPQNYAGKTLTIAQSTDPYGGELQKHDGVALRRDVVLRLCLRERAGGGELSDCRTRRPGLPADRTAEGRDLLLRRRAGGDCGGEHHHADHGTAHILLGTVGSRNQPCRSDGGAGHGSGGSGTSGDHPPDGGASAGPAL